MNGIISEIRSIQEIRSSYILYLPKEWCRENNIGRGSKIIIKGRSRRLMLEPLTEGLRTQEIHIEEFNITTLKYILISLYVMGHRSIRLIFKRNLSSKDRRRIREILKILRNFEIYEDGRNYIVIRDLGGASDIKSAMMKEFNSAFNLVRLLKETSMSLLSGDNNMRSEELAELLDSLEELDTEIDMSRMEVKRLYSKILDDLSIDPGIDHKILSNLIVIGNILERIGDHAILALRILLEKKRIPREIVKILDHIERTENIIARELDTILRNIPESKSEDLKTRLNTTLKELAEIIELKKSLREVASLNSDESGQMIIYHVVRIFDYLTDIAEYIIDMLVEISVSSSHYKRTSP